MISQPHWLFGVLFALIGLALTLGAGRNLFKSPKWIKPFRGPVIALEFARTPADAANVFAAAAAETKDPAQTTDDPATAGGVLLQSGRGWLADQLEIDQKIIIPAYVLVLSAAAILVWWCAPMRFGIAAHVAGVVVCVALTGVAAGFDVAENNAALRAIEATRDMGGAETLAADIGPALDAGRRAATAKFALLYGVLLVLAVPLLMRGGWGAWLAALLAVTAVFGFVSLLPSFYRFVEWAFTLMGLCLLLAGLWLIRPGGTTAATRPLITEARRAF